MAEEGQEPRQRPQTHQHQRSQPPPPGQQGYPPPPGQQWYPPPPGQQGYQQPPPPYQQYPYPYPPQYYPYPQPPAPAGPKPPPWGDQDPVVWSVRKARNQALWGSIAIALLVLAFGGGWYSLFTEFIYEGEENVEGYGLIWVVIAILVLPIVGAVASGSLLRTGRRVRGEEGAPDGLSYANPILAISILLFLLMYIAFVASATIKEGDFPVGILRVFPVYVGFCIAVYVTGASFIAWSDSTRLEAGIAMALGWGAFLMFIVYSSLVNPDRVADDGWDQIIFWLRFGLLIASILPFLIVVGLWYSYRRALELLDVASGPPLGPDQEIDVTVEARAVGEECGSCGAVLAEHPRTGEVFCPACGEGLLSEQEVPWPPP